MASTERPVEQIVEALRGDGQVAKVILFGSQARGDAGEDSDWDVMVVERGTVDRIREGSRLRDKLRGVGIAIDLVVVSREKFDYWRETPGNVYYEAAVEGKVVYEAA
ncbi:MAG: nucleotidyltransferase domain-containing protein [Burkholderiales bacterium]|nr:nucleotidyltransferase domain-containing protein [Burkholderiales bacterium]